ncbi:MAG: homoserine dehydrogenase [Hyphomicrobiaceae bacterium]|jgi:homoserine dehydrogenase
MGKTVRLGIAGLGTVGCGLVELLTANAERMTLGSGCKFAISGVSARDKSKDRGIALGADVIWHSDPVALATAPETDVFVELIGGSEGAAREAVTAALKAGKPVVTANKALLADHGVELAGFAEEAGVALAFEAAVAGGIPVIKAMRESLIGNSITRVYGILNGTCNYILTRMQEEGLAFEDVLKDAQALGYAEADPTFDVGGFDTAHKLSLLTSLAFGSEGATFEQIHVEGIERITPADIEAADDLGYRIKLLGVSMKTDSGIEQRVHPAMVAKGSAIAQVSGVTNGVAIDGDFVGDILLVGPGAGGGATASAVAADIAEVARGAVFAPFVTPAAKLAPYKRAQLRKHQGAYYLRLSVYDKPGAMAAIATRMGEQNVSLESIVQRRSKAGLPGSDGLPEPGELASVILITHKTNEQAIRDALAAIEADGKIADKPQVIRIEEL